MARKSEILIGFSFGLSRVTEHYFYYALTLTSLYPQTSPETQQSYWITLTEYQDKFKLWSDNCPENFLHKYLLISAEIARIANRELEAMELYDRAIESAKENEFCHNASIASELTAKFYLNRNQEKVASVYLKDAYYGYLQWGAIGKVKNLEQKYASLLSNIIVQKSQKNKSGLPSMHLSLDLSTIIKAYQTLSSEIALGKLLEKLMKIAIENAGAQKGFLILNREGKLTIEAEGAIDSEEVTILQAIPLDSINSLTQTTYLSVAIINYVSRSQKDVVLNDATREEQFIADPYILITQPKSILSIPLLHQGKLRGILYLENNLTTNAFSSDRVEILKILSSQAAISIENSYLYERLEESSNTLAQKVEERTREIVNKNEQLAATLQTLKKTQAQIIAQEKLASLGTLTAGIAHEIKNPLNFVNNFAELSIELTQELFEEIDSQKNKIDSESFIYIQEILQDLSQNAQKINEHGKRADKIVHGMLMHSRGESGSRQLTSINALLAEAINLVYHGMRAKDPSFNITVEIDYDDTLEPIYVIPQDISRVFLNIINNACYAARQNKSSEEHEFSPQLRVSTKNLEAFVEICIRDNGIGIPLAIQTKIFTPFFTTKPTGEGTGLGLSISYDIIVQSHQGEIRIESQTNKYTEFIITLPKTVSPNSGITT
jgi:signal transduction histidine kinase